jgi:thymidylate kinase
MSRRGQLIVVEGPDGVGKSTLAAALTSGLSAAGVPCRLIAFPGREPNTLGSLVYQLHHAPMLLGVGAMTPAAVQTMHVAAHLDAIDRVIQPVLNSGESVVLDRFWWSTWVYGLASGLSADFLDSLIAIERRFWRASRPMIAFLIDPPKPWRTTEETPTWQALAMAYRQLALQEKAHHPVEILANDGDRETVSAEMTKTVVGMLTVATDPKGGEDQPPELQRRLRFDRVVPVQPTVPRSLSVGRIGALKPTQVYDTYWRFAAERQNVFFRRLEGNPPPWTSDQVILRHRFTNAYRASDRVSQYLIRHVLYAGDQDPDNLFFRTIIFKLFNRVETWELLERTLGSVNAGEFVPDRYDQVLRRAMQAGQRIYSAAYIMPALRGQSGAKHTGHLLLLERMLHDELPRRLSEARSLREAFELLRAYPMMGDFLAFQYVIDLNYSRLLNFSEMEFVVPGPGARGGIRKCFRDLGGLSESDVIRLVTEGQEEEFRRRGLAFRDLWGRPLQLIDCQNLFCEVDKYARVAHPDMTDAGGRTRIKQVFRPAGRQPWPWYPPKWGINEKIAELQEARNARD